METTYEAQIRQRVRDAVRFYAAGFQDRHLGQLEDPDGTINSKVNNIFIAALGTEVRFFSALVRSLDSSMGNFIESLALALAEENFNVTRSVEGTLYSEQTTAIATLLEDYKSRRRMPSVLDYQHLRLLNTGTGFSKVHNSDYVLENIKTGQFNLIELKFGGDLDNKKARSEKEALLEQFCILSNKETSDAQISIHFATGYNRYGEGQLWKQERVRMFFAEDELLISSDFWNFIIQDSRGFEIVIDEYTKNAYFITEALDVLKDSYVR